VGTRPFEASAAGRLRPNLRVVVRRLSFTFARGGPGLGLLLIRLVASTALIAHAVTKVLGAVPIAPVTAISAALSATLGILLLAGLWTPIAGGLVALAALGHALAQPADRWAGIMVGILGVALALLGPGVWSVDARLFGWRRLEIRDPQKPEPPPF
jgi:uncharacterized membrane protein YphA (DoxX/SURF4 family)